MGITPLPPSIVSTGRGASHHAYTHQTPQGPRVTLVPVHLLSSNQGKGHQSIPGPQGQRSDHPRSEYHSSDHSGTKAGLNTLLPLREPQLLPVPNSLFDFLSEAGLGDFLSEDAQRQGSLQNEHVLLSLLLPAEASAKGKLGRALAPDALPFGRVPLPPGRHCSLPKQPRNSPCPAPVPARAVHYPTQEVKYLLGIHTTVAESQQRMTGPRIRPQE